MSRSAWMVLDSPSGAEPMRDLRKSGYAAGASGSSEGPANPPTTTHHGPIPQLPARSLPGAERRDNRRRAGLRSATGTGRAGRGKTGGRREEKWSRPISRVLSRATIPLGPLSPAASSDLPGSPRGDGASPLPSRLLPYLVLLQVGFTVPRRVTTRAVRSYRTFSPLPQALRPEAVCFLWHFPWARAPQALPGTLPAGARTFLPGLPPSDRLADSSAHHSINGHRC